MAQYGTEPALRRAKKGLLETQERPSLVETIERLGERELAVHVVEQRGDGA